MKTQTTLEVEYPETDGRPMGETDLHRDWMFRIIELLKCRYRDQRVYVTGDLLMYYKEGDPSKFVVPDAMVVKDCDPGRRRIFKLWDEKRAPSVVFETTSRSTKREDSSFKAPLYAQLRIPEYFLYDPTADYLHPPLQGWRLRDDEYKQIEADSAGRLHCRELGIWLRLEDGDLVMYDFQTGERLLTEAETAEAALEAAEAEIQRLREKLRDQGISERS